MGKINKFQYGYKVPTKTWGDIGDFFNKGAEVTLKVLEPVGKAISSVVSNLPQGGASAVLPQQSPKNFQQAKQREKIFEEKVGPALSPTNHVVAWTQGSLDPAVGQRKIAEWGPAAQLGSFITDIAAFKYAPKVVKNTPTVVDKALATTGNKGAKSRVIAREIDKNIPKGRLEVTDNYFHAPDKWYRIANRPEKMGIEQEGKNITTRDADYTPGTPNRWRSDMQDIGEVDFSNGPNGGRHLEPGKGTNEGYFIFMPGSRIYKTGSAHGNTSQASKGGVWKGGVAGNSELFPQGIIEGQAPSVIPYGRTRSHFVNTPWEEVPEGGRVGFHTGEMPMSNLGWFQRLPNGRYTYEPIIPEKRIYFDPNKKFRILGSQPRLVDSKTYPIYRGPRFSVNSVVNPDGTVNPRQAMRVQHTVSKQFPGSYKMEGRLENSRWHKDDPTTYDHARNVAQSAWKLPTPEGFTKQDQMIAALGHDFGKMVSGEGHAQIGADLARQVFPDLTEAQYKAIAEHMGQSFSSPLGEITKAADITNGRSFNYLQRFSPELYNKYLGNTVYRVTQPNGKIRLQLPSHTEAKPRQFVLDPKGDNKYYVHMRVWDDVDKKVPATMSSAEKNTLFEALYNELPDGAEILFPKSGPGNYATRGTVAGLQHLSRDPRFTPGTKGTLQYTDKDGKTVKTYEGTSFIKRGEDQYSKEPVVRGKDYEDYVTRLGDEFLNHGAKVKPIEPDPELTKMIDRVGFTPIFQMWPGARLRAHSKEIIRRLEQQGMDVDKETARLPMVGWGTVREVINKNAQLPSQIGYFHKSGVTGLYNKRTGITLVDPTEYNKTVSTMQHERNMHGTQKILTPSMWNPYERFLHNIFGHGNVNMREVNNKKYYSITDPENISQEHPITGGALKKEELRATLGQYRKNLYDNVAYSRAKADGVDIPREDLEPLRPYFEAAVDELNLPQVKMDLSAINGYGRAYAKHGPKWHPNFLEELKELLKYSPGILPFMRNEKE